MAATQSDEKATASSPSHDAETPLAYTSNDKDIAINLVGEHAQDIDPAIEAKVLRKIDLFLIPAMIVGMHTSPTLRPSPYSFIPFLSNPTPPSNMLLTNRTQAMA